MDDPCKARIISSEISKHVGSVAHLCALTHRLVKVRSDDCIVVTRQGAVVIDSSALMEHNLRNCFVAKGLGPSFVSSFRFVGLQGRACDSVVGCVDLGDFGCGCYGVDLL